MEKSFKLFLVLMIAMISSSILAGCSTVIYERKKDEAKPTDQGVESSFKLQGPRAVVQTNF